MVIKICLRIITWIISSLVVFTYATELPEGFTRHDDVIFPVQWRISRLFRDSSGLQTTVKELIGQKKGIVILYQWSNRMADTVNHKPEHYEEIFFSTGVYPTGSLNDYFLENSCGKFSLDGDVTQWYTSSYPYNISNQYIWMERAVVLADPDVDFSQYDSDGDGYVDITYLLHAGPAGEETMDSNDPWSWALVWGADIPTNDGVLIGGYTLQPEEHADSSIMGIGVTRHESGHILAWFPDLYDYDDKLDTTTYYTPDDANDHPVQDWCSMGYGGYGLFSYRYGPGPAEHPSHYCGLFKTLVGWVEPIVLDHSQPGVTIYSIEQHDSASLYKVPVNGSEWEYFLIENRHTEHPGLFDHLDSDYSAFFSSFTPGPNPLDSGLIIIHVDEEMSNTNYWGFNDGTPSKPHYGAVIEDPGYNPNIPWNGTEFTEFWYPYECQVGAAFSKEDGQITFTPYTTPNSDGYNGPTGIWITHISCSGEVMTFDIYLESDPPVFADVYSWSDTSFTGPYSVYAVILDTFGIRSDSLYYAVNDVPYNSVDHDSVISDSLYWYTLPYTASPGDSLTYYVVATDSAFNRGLSGTYVFRVIPPAVKEQDIDSEKASHLNLFHSTPNPFHTSTMISYQLSQASFISLKIYDIAGELVTTLVNESQNAGMYHVYWNGQDSYGRRVSSGVYFSCLNVRGTSVARQIVFLK
jgi:M6 family metalloprotease-like protein